MFCHDVKVAMARKRKNNTPQNETSTKQMSIKHIFAREVLTSELLASPDRSCPAHRPCAGRRDGAAPVPPASRFEMDRPGLGLV